MDPRIVAGKPDLHLIDVRESHEWQQGHISVAEHIPMSQITGRVHELPKDRKLVAVCRSGSRSRQVTKFLRAQGFDIENLDGGMKAWANAGLPVTRPDGGPGRVA